MLIQAPDVKERIITFLQRKGPSLPVHIAKEIGSSILFTSAFLSELLSEKRLKMSNMKIGSSSLYFLSGQEPMLENFSSHLKSKEKEAFTMLSEKKFLKDSEQLPAIRIALREIKDFAIPFRKNEDIIWRFFTALETDFLEEKTPKKVVEESPKESVSIITKTHEEPSQESVSEKIVENIKETATLMTLPQKREVKKTKIRIKPKQAKKKLSSKTKSDEKFLNRIKDFLSKNSIEIINIEGLKRDELVLRVKVDGTEQLLVAYKTNKISEKEIIKASKKAGELNLSYSILSMGELPKRISELTEALKGIRDIKKVE